MGSGLTFYAHGSTVVGNLSYGYGYGYDAAGHRIQIGGSLARMRPPAAVSSASYNAANQLTSWGGAALSYDANGNLTGDGNNTYTWDSRNRLTGISGGTTASFAYDGVGRRTSKTVSGASTAFIYDGLNPVQELNGSTPTATLLAGGLDQWFARTDASGTKSFLTDALGSVLAQTDGTGTIQTQYGYEPYGKTTQTGAASGNAAQYTGRENDGTGLYYYRARYYAPGLGRFIAEDPVRFDGGWNTYTYVDGDPISGKDPLGNFGLIGAGIGFGFDLVTQLASNGGNWRCISLGELAASTALGAIGGGAGGRGLTAALRGLSNATKGSIGEALSMGENWLSGSRLVNTQTRIPGFKTIADSTWESFSGSRYYVESKFGTSGLTSAQRAAANSLGGQYRIERWGYPFFERVGEYFGGTAGALSGSRSGGNCGC